MQREGNARMMKRKGKEKKKEGKKGKATQPDGKQNGRRSKKKETQRVGK